MTQERIIAQIKPRLRHYLEHRDGPGICAFTTMLVHRHGHPLLEHLLSQPEWSSYRLWWGEQIGHLNPGLQPPSDLQPQQFKTRPEGKAHPEDKDPIRTKNTSAQVGPTPSPQKYPEPQEGEGLHLDEDPANQTEALDQARDDIKITPAQVTKRRLKMAQLAAQREDGGEVTMTPAASKKRLNKGSSDRRQCHSLRLRSWLPSSCLPHQLPQQDAA